MKKNKLRKACLFQCPRPPPIFLMLKKAKTDKSEKTNMGWHKKNYRGNNEKAFIVTKTVSIFA